MKKRLSLIIPTYNCAEFLDETLGSVLPQLPDDCELIVVDDGYADETPDLLRKYADRHQGLSFGEDRLFNYEYLRFCRSVITSSVRMFRYMQRNPESASKRSFPDYFNTIICHGSYTPEGIRRDHGQIYRGQQSYIRYAR